MTAYTLNFSGKLLTVNRPLVMGILNVTPDSFFDGGKFTGEKALLNQAEKMLAESASVIDVGGMSSRPGATEIPLEEEMGRVVPAVKSIAHTFPGVIISVDTYRSDVAKAALDHGASMINDISAGKLDAGIFKVAAQYNCPLVLMHMQGTPATMLQNPVYENILAELLDYFIKRVNAARQAGVKDLVIDPGFGFGKTVDQNYKLLKNISIFGLMRVPVLAGVSRKRMITNVLGVNPADALNGTTAAHVLALQSGAQMLRVHDVQAAQEAIKIWEQYKLA